MLTIVMVFQTLCDSNYIEIFDGPDTRFKSFGKMCGENKLPSDIVSTNNELFITYHASLTQSAEPETSQVVSPSLGVGWSSVASNVNSGSVNKLSFLGFKALFQTGKSILLFLLIFPSILS